MFRIKETKHNKNRVVTDLKRNKEYLLRTMENRRNQFPNNLRDYEYGDTLISSR